MNVVDELKIGLRPFVARDVSGDLALLIGAIGVMAQPIVDLVSDDPDTGAPGYSSLVDIDRVSDADLGYLAQFVGVKLKSGLDPDAQRARVRSTDGMRRGRPGSIVGAAQQHLTGNKMVILRERFNSNTGLPDPYWAQVITYEPETPNPGLTENDVLAQDPGGIQLTFEVLTGQDWLSVRNNYPTWQAVRDAYGNWQAVRDDVPS